MRKNMGYITEIKCRFCNAELTHEFIDLGYQPPSNSFLSNLNEPETTYPLKAYVCDQCFLVQVPESKKASEIFKDDYVYFSSQSPSNVSHAKEFADKMCERFGLGTESKVLEIGSNDGYLLQWFKERGCDVLGFEPADGPAEEAEKKGIKSLSFFTSTAAMSHPDNADLICGINVIAHQPDINDFVKGVRIALKPDGVAVFEFPHLMRTIEGCQFDQFYAEHFSYFSLMTVSAIFIQHGLLIFDADEIPEHGGSLRIYAGHSMNRNHWLHFDCRNKMDRINSREYGMDNLNYYSGFRYKVNKIKTDLVSFLIEQKKLGKAVVGYGAPAKASTLLNYCGIRSDLLPFVVDRSPYKVGKYLPGSHISVRDEDHLKSIKPEYVLILAWNLKEEIMKQLSYIRDWNAKFVVAIPELTVTKDEVLAMGFVMKLEVI
jgi:SAM-dependent methyltransferase